MSLISRVFAAGWEVDGENLRTLEVAKLGRKTWYWFLGELDFSSILIGTFSFWEGGSLSVAG